MKNIILPDIVAAGIYNAQIVHKNKTATPQRKTTMFEIELPLDNGGISYINDTSHPIRENTVICAKPGQLRHTRLPFRCYYVHIIVSEGELFDLLSSLPDFIELSDASEIRETLASLSESYNNGSPREMILAQSLLLNLIYTLVKRADSSKPTYKPKSSNRAVIEQTVRYIKENLSEELSLESLSLRMNFSPIYFHKLFKASTGRTLREYIEEQRIKRAAELLTSTDKTLTQIAYECGFSSQSYFSYAFKRKTASTPREYAKMIQLKYENAKTDS